MVTLEILNHWLEGRENECLEFKEAKNQFDFSKLKEYCVALANEGGGYLVLGVSDKPPRKIVGTNAFLNTDEIKLKIFESLRFRIEISQINHQNGRVLVFEVPSRPTGQAVHCDGKYLMRLGENLVPMTADRLRHILLEGKTNFLELYATDIISPDNIISALDIQTFFDLIKIPLPTTQKAILERLVAEKLIQPNGNEYRITNLGAILLAKDMTQFDSIKRKSVRVVKYAKNNKLETERDIILKKGYASGFEELISHINSQLPSNEVIEQALRKEVRMFPEIAIRELVANALIHQDMDQGSSHIMIEVYSDRIEITNPGSPLIPTNRFVDAYQSRNEKLADLMRRMGICEEKGSGIDKVVFSTELYQLPAPDIRATEWHTTVVLFAHKAFSQMDAFDRTRACYLHCCLKYVSNERMTNQSLRERFKLEDTRSKSTTVSQIISSTMEQDLIKSDNLGSTSKRYARYIPFWA